MHIGAKLNEKTETFKCWKKSLLLSTFIQGCILYDDITHVAPLNSLAAKNWKKKQIVKQWFVSWIKHTTPWNLGNLAKKHLPNLIRIQCISI